ncbi:MAG: Flp family type IVb pilin [Armatimonadota bacterium]|nr:Flp family type IVb pilin [Armatimonadota bacterium]
MLREFLIDERGDITQNAVFLAVLIILTIAALRLLGGNIRDLFNRIAGIVANPTQ